MGIDGVVFLCGRVGWLRFLCVLGWCGVRVLVACALGLFVVVLGGLLSVVHGLGVDEDSRDNAQGNDGHLFACMSWCLSDVVRWSRVELTYSHQKLLQPTLAAMGPDMMGPTWKSGQHPDRGG